MSKTLVCWTVLVVGWACGQGRTQESILGLPAPRDPNKPGAVLLHGGGRITEDAFTRFVELAGGEKARIVLVPSAGYRPADYPSRQEFQTAMSRRFSSWFRLASTGKVQHCEVLATDNPEDADNPAFVRPLGSATGVWFCGGVQSRLNYRYVGPFPQQTRFQGALRSIVERGGVVGGMSAGMAAIPEIMTMHQDRPTPVGPVRLVAAHGLGLLSGAIVETHFESRGGRLERFTGLLRDSARLDLLAGRRGVGAKMLGLAAESSTALVLQADRVQVLGGAEAHVFVKSPDGRALTWHTLKAGEQVSLKRDEQGQVVLARGR